ncbi:protein kleE [Salmonella enterica]|nr:protein kleE [Salmonella enterica]
MSKIIKFPGVQDEPVAPTSPPEVPAKPARRFTAAAVLNVVVRFVWVITVLVWPVAKWIISIDVFFQFLRMFYHWDTPGVHAGWTFLAHFAVLTALTYFVSLYKPKGL